MSVLDGLIGSILVATILSTILFGILTVQVQSYYSRFPKDPTWVKVMVGTLWLADCAHQVGTCVVCYNYMITHFHEPSYLYRTMTALSVTVTMEPIPAIIAQCYYARRLYLMNPKWWPVSTLTVIMAICAFGFAQACGTISYTLPYLEDFKRYTGLVAAWLITCCVCDIVISTSVARQLIKSRIGYEATDRLLTKLAVWTMNTGLAPAAVALFDVITFIVLAESLVYFGANIVLAKLYSNSVLAFLNRRKSNKRIRPANLSSSRHVHMTDFVLSTSKSVNTVSALNQTSTVADIPAPSQTSKQQGAEPEDGDIQVPAETSTSTQDLKEPRRSIQSIIEIANATPSVAGSSKSEKVATS